MLDERFEWWEDAGCNFAQVFVNNAKDGVDGIKEYYEIARKEVAGDYKEFVRLIYDLNMLSWFYYEYGDNEKSKAFSDLYYKADDEFYEIYDDDKEALSYHFRRLV